jgi:tetratricopeptide (TPR) repeat protein
MGIRGGDGSVFEEIKQRAQSAVDCGQLEGAEALIEQALDWARQNGTGDQVDHAICNRAAIAIQLGRGDGELPNLREILMRSGNLENCRLAAYHISLFYEFCKNFKKSLFYARIARDRAELLGVPDWLAVSHNQIGNALLGESFVAEACLEYQRALDLMPGEAGVGRALILQNLGYCRILEQRFDEGYELLYQSSRQLRRLGAEHYETLINLDLCFAHLETGRFGHARRRGLAALRLAEKGGQHDAAKNALYLLGEAANLSGDAETARSYFSRLQRDFFPEAGYLPGFLLAVDVRKLINLHA